MKKIDVLHHGESPISQHVVRLFIKPKEKIAFIDITDEVKRVLSESGIQNGVVHIYSRHTTAAIRINENEKFLLEDFRKYLEHLIPSNEKFRHDDFRARECTPDERVNARAHIANLLMGISETIPVVDGEMPLGKYQSIFLVDLDGGRKTPREVIITVIGSR